MIKKIVHLKYDQIKTGGTVGALIVGTTEIIEATVIRKEGESNGAKRIKIEFNFQGNYYIRRPIYDKNKCRFLPPVLIVDIDN